MHIAVQSGLIAAKEVIIVICLVQYEQTNMISVEQLVLMWKLKENIFRIEIVMKMRGNARQLLPQIMFWFITIILTHYITKVSQKNIFEI